MTKKFLGLMSGLFLLSGCSNVHFDNLEYDKYVTFTIRANSLVAACDEPSIPMGVMFLLSEATYLKEYANHRAARDQIKTSANTLYSLVDELNSRYKVEDGSQPSVSYCEQKLKTIATTSEAISNTLGRL